MVGNFDGFPIQEVGGFFALDLAHESAAGVGSGVGGRFEHGVFEVGLPLAVGKSQAEAAAGIDVMEFEVLRFEPGMAPIESFVFAEFLEEILFGYPVNDADQGIKIA